MSTSVDIKGVAMIAGSSPIFFATSGNVHPTTLAINTVHAMVRPMVNAIIASPCPISMIRMPLTTDKMILIQNAIRISFQITLNRSENSIYPTASPRITSVELCEPQFPPVPVNIGTNPASCGISASAFS